MKNIAEQYMDVDTYEASPLRQVLGEALAGMAEAGGGSDAVEAAQASDAIEAIDAIAGMDHAQPAPGQPDAREGARQFPRLMPVASAAAQPGARTVKVADIAAFERLAEQDALTEFRVFRSFGYSVVLFFHAAEMVFYTVLYQDGAPWRVMTCADHETSESVFVHFEERARRWAEGEARCALVKARNEHLARLFEQSEQRAERLRSDLQRVALQEQALNARQQQVRRELARLEGLRVTAQAQLNKSARQAHQLMLAENEGLPHLPVR
ncbi:DUF2968 domain-containing protein [Cupriavidus sp. 30B13]|uniref:DUF2968 domain-containing protein n=1 Tax=Cupriavidus sp. 30B13 TaxID=3384241 RepID=UPI003B911B07